MKVCVLFWLPLRLTIFSCDFSEIVLDGLLDFLDEIKLPFSQLLDSAIEKFFDCEILSFGDLDSDEVRNNFV